MELVPDVSRRVREPPHENGSTEYHAAVCHLFCVKLGDSATTTHGKLQQAFGDDAMARAQAFRWQKMFSEGRTIVEDEQRSGRPSTTRTSDNRARVRELVRSDRRLTVKMIADEVNVNREAGLRQREFVTRFATRVVNCIFKLAILWLYFRIYMITLLVLHC